MKNLLLSLGCIGMCFGADWLTFSGDPQRTGFAKGETQLSRDNVSKLHVEWSLKLDNVPLELNALTVPVIVENQITPKGFKDLVLVAGSSDQMFAIDADKGKLLWHDQFDVQSKPKHPTHWLCPDALNADPIIDKSTKSVYVLSSDGMLHTLNYIDGEDQKPPVQFVPPFGKTWSLNLYKGVLYTTTSQGCNTVRSAIYAMDVKDPNRPVSKFTAGQTGGAGIWGRAGGAISSTTGLIYSETGDGPYDPTANKFSDTFLGVGPDGKLADYYTPTNRAWITKKDLDMGNMSPVVFPFQQWELVAGGGKEGALYLLDSKQLGGADHRTPLYRSALLTNDDVDFAGHGFWGALSTWQDEQSTRWLYAPAWGPPAASVKFPVTNGDVQAGSVMAFKVTVQDGKPVLSPAWISENMSVPEPVAIANGVVFALSSGENVKQVDNGGRILSSKERAESPSGNAILYALDATTGKELYSSKDAIPGFTHFSGLAISNGRVYVVTHDSTIYAFSTAQ